MRAKCAVTVNIHVPWWGWSLIYGIACLNKIGIKPPAEKVLRMICRHSVKVQVAKVTS